jgi:hypothetical protein
MHYKITAMDITGTFCTVRWDASRRSEGIIGQLQTYIDTPPTQRQGLPLPQCYLRVAALAATALAEHNLNNWVITLLNALVRQGKTISEEECRYRRMLRSSVVNLNCQDKEAAKALLVHALLVCNAVTLIEMEPDYQETPVTPA